MGGDSPARRTAADSNGLPAKTYKPIASVAALPERHWQLQILKQFRRPCRFPDLSLRGAKRRGNLSRGLPRWTGHRRTCVLTDLTVAALPERHVRDNSTAGGRWCTAAPPDVSLCGARRRGALRAKREEVPLGCNLAVPGRITGKPRRIQGTK